MKKVNVSINVRVVLKNIGCPALALRPTTLPCTELVLLCRHASYTLDLFFHQYKYYTQHKQWLRNLQLKKQKLMVDTFDENLLLLRVFYAETYRNLLFCPQKPL